MSVIIPEEDELRSRILAHLQARPSNPLVPAVWQGYIAGLLEWGIIDVATHGRLCDLLPEPGKAEMVEIMMGSECVDARPDSRDQDRRFAAE